MKKLIVLFLFAYACNLPYKVMTTYSTDSLGKKTKTVTKWYDTTSHQYNDYRWERDYFFPYYDPWIYPWRSQIYVQPRVVVPIRPNRRK